MQQYGDKIWAYMKKDYSGQWGMDIDHWDWVPGVGVIALMEYYEAVQNPEILAFLIDWVKRNHIKSEGNRVINSIAPYAIFPALFRLTGDRWYLEEAEKVAQWLITDAPRTREQAFEHTVTEKASFSEQVWADTIFMAVLFLARTAAAVQNRQYAEEALNQVLLHLKLLQDPESGVLFHGWNCDAGNHMSAARWTRANAWVAAGVPMILEEVATLVPVPEEINGRYGKLIRGLVEYQQADGLWSTVMDQSGFYREISGSAGIGCGIRLAIDTGLTGTEEQLKEVPDTVLQAVLPYLSEDGEVSGVSGGTPVMESVAAYNEIPRYPTLYGQGLVLLLIAGTIRSQG